MSRRNASVVDGGIMFGNITVEPTQGVSAETASCYGSSSVSIGQSEVSSLLSPNMTSFDELDLDDNDITFPLESEDIVEEKADSIEDEITMFGHNRHFFILSSAGKPIYALHGSQNLLVVYAGIIQTIISFYQFAEGGGEEIRNIDSVDSNGNPIMFCFLNRSPILLMAISRDGAVGHVELTQQLEFLHNFLLATLSKPFIDKTFSKRANFDLRQVLGQTDIATLDSICTGLANGAIMDQVVGGLECIRMRQSTRTRLERKMLKFKSENLLYALVVGPGGKLVDIMRPKRHTLHISDLSILFEMVYKTGAFKSAPASNGGRSKAHTRLEVNSACRESCSTDSNGDDNLKLTTNETFWLPLCLPKFNATGHLYTLMQFHQMNDPRLFDLHDVPRKDLCVDEDESKIGIIVITPYRDQFEEMREIATGIARSIMFDKTIWQDVWRGLLGSNRIMFEDVIDSLSLIRKAPTERRGTYSSVRGIFGQDPAATSHVGGTSALLPRVNSQERVSSSVQNRSFVPFHFVVKNRRLTQFVYPQSHNYDVRCEVHRMRLTRLYSNLRRALTAHPAISLRVVEWGSHVGLAALISGYEIYIVGEGPGGGTCHDEMVAMAMGLVGWARREETRLFIGSGCVF